MSVEVTLSRKQRRILEQQCHMYTTNTVFGEAKNVAHLQLPPYTVTGPMIVSKYL